MFGRVLLALDAFEGREALITAAAALASAPGGEVIALHVRETEVEGDGIAERACQELRARGVKVTCHTVDAAHELVATAIVAAAGSFGAGVIVAGSHGEAELRARLTGSISREVVNRTDLPLLLVPAGAGGDNLAGHFDTVLAAFEAGADLRQIVDAVAALGGVKSVVALHVNEMPNTPEAMLELEPADAGEALLTEAVEEFRAAGLEVSVAAANGVVGTVGAAIAREAAALKVDAIVVGSRRPRGIEAILVGSTARSVIRHAKCPVLIASPARLAVAA